MSVRFYTSGADQTVALGRRLAAHLKPGSVVAFHGDLGAGKTTMIKGVCAGLGVTETVKSPSFVVITEYRGRTPIYHIDLYRLERSEALQGLGLDSYFAGDGVCLVEWAERAGTLLPDDAIRVRIEFTPDGRAIEVSGLPGFTAE